MFLFTTMSNYYGINSTVSHHEQANVSDKQVLSRGGNAQW